MRCISLLLLWTAGVWAADFTTGQAARAMIGQANFTDQNPNSSNTVLGALSGIAYAADTLFVADSNPVQATPSNNRVLAFQNLSSQLPSPTARLTYNPQQQQCPICVGQATLVLGQPDFVSSSPGLVLSQSNLRTPTAVASDGIHLAVADSDHNRVLIWNRIPQTNNAPADVVVGQPDFVSSIVPPNNIPNARSLLGPEGVWIQNGKLYVADTGNNRILIYSQIPATNGVAADVVLGQPNFNSYVQIDVSQQTTAANASNMLNPVSVTSDGQRLYVADLANNRILIWNSIPTANGAPADVAIGQPDLNSSIPNYAYTVDTTNSACQQNPIGTACLETPVLCTVSNGVDVNSNPTYPNVCNATLNFPRFALAAGNRLFVADGGNDRVLVFDAIPTQSGASADVIIGQIGAALGDEVTQAYDAADSLQTPMSLAWDGANLFVSDPFDRRITVYSMGANSIPYSGVRNAASFEVFATGSVTLSGLINSGDIATITITQTTNGTTTTNNYSYTVQTVDTLTSIVDGLVKAINSSNNGAGDPYVVAVSDHVNNAVRLFARVAGSDGDTVVYTTATSANAKLALQTAGTALTGGSDASQIAPGSLISIFASAGTVLAYGTAQADLSQNQLPTELAGAQVYLNGIPAPLMYVSPTQINAQIPWEVANTTSINAYVVSTESDGVTMAATTPVAVTIVPANPGIFTYFTGSGPQRQGVVLHGSSSATGVVSIDGTTLAGDTGTITIDGRAYSYTVQSADTLATVRDAFVAMINAADPEVRATPTAEFTRMILQARIQGPAGEGIPYSVNVVAAPVSNGGELLLTAFTNTLCCSNVQGSPVTTDNPAIVGETILVYATGLGLPVPSDATAAMFKTGMMFPANTPVTSPQNDVSATTAAVTANVLQVAAKPGTFGVWELMLQLDANLTTDSSTQLTVSQNSFLSNLVTIPVVNPALAAAQ